MKKFKKYKIIFYEIKKIYIYVIDKKIFERKINNLKNSFA